MKQLTCIAIDDEPLALELIEHYASRIPALKLIATFEDALSAAEYIKLHTIDLLLVDINMPDISGIELIRSLEVKPLVIFTTAYKQFAYEGFELEAVDYILKPIDFERFSKAISKAADYYQYKNSTSSPGSNESLYVYSEYRMIKVEVDKIEYIESMEDYIKIHAEGQSRPVLTLMPLKKIQEKLPENKFIRIHRSYIVAINRIKSVYNKKIQLASIELPIGKSYYETVSNAIR